MERIAKTPESIQPVSAPQHKTTQGISTLRYEDVPIDVYRFFERDIGTVDSKELDQLKAISSWAFRDVETLGDGLIKLRDLEIKLGVPSSGESRENKIYNWITLQKQIDDLRKRQEALNG
jgi:hypothetical protein